jgi:hypothetical protein
MVIRSGLPHGKASEQKYKGAGADVADKIVKQLLRDLEKLEKGTDDRPRRSSGS